MSKKTYVNFGTINESKSGGLYLKLDKGVKLTINGKDYSGSFFVNDPEQKYKIQLNSGKINESKYEESISKIPEYIRKEIIAVFEE